ncbi:MAG: hypothetical protein AAF611_05470 [Bacteroidota bacterium]
MKKKQMNSKLNLKKTTIVSFKDMKNIIGGTIVNTDTTPISQNGISCQNSANCNTINDEVTCTTYTGDDCNTSNTTRTVNTDNTCVGTLSQKGCVGP